MEARIASLHEQLTEGEPLALLEQLQSDHETLTVAVSQLQSKAAGVEERVALVVKQVVRDLQTKIDASVRKELERVSTQIVFEVGGDKELEAKLAERVRDFKAGLGLSLELSLGDLPTSVGSKAAALFVDLVSVAEFESQAKLEERASDLEAAAANTQPPPVVPRPAAVPARPLSLQATPSDPPPRPAVPSKPRPNTVAVVESHDQTPAEQDSHSDAAEVVPETASEPVAEVASEEHHESKPPAVQARNKNLMSDLNRMLAAPPTSAHRVSATTSGEDLDSETTDLSTEKKADEDSSHVEALSAEKVEEIPSLAEVAAAATAAATAAAAAATTTATIAPTGATPAPVAAVTSKASNASLPTTSNPALNVSTPAPPVTPKPASTTTPAPPVEKTEKKGLMGMLSHLTKSRPKAGRAASKKGSESAAVDKAEVPAEAKESSASADALAATTSADVLAQQGEEVQSEPTTIQPEVAEVEVAVQEPTPVAAAPESNSEPEAFVPPRPPVPVPRPRPAPGGAGESRSSVVESRQSIAEGRKSLVVDNTATPITPTTPSYHAGMVDMMTGAPAPPPRPRPAPRTESADRPLSTLSQTESPHESLEQVSASNNGTEEQHTTNAVTTEDGGDVPARPVIPPKPPVKKIPGVFSNQRGHNAMAALASAMNSRAASVGAGARSSVVGGEEHAVTPSTPTDAAGDQSHDAHHVEANGESASSLPHHMSAEALQPARRLSDNSSADPHLQSPVLLAQPLNIKKVAHSVSGDDKAIEKHALDWLNLHLASKEIVVDDLYTSLGDGLKLIYALEDATGESVGKYNKRAALPVHKIDNCAVALNFLQKKGINTQFMTPQDMLDGKKDKILTLFNYITKKF